MEKYTEKYLTKAHDRSSNHKQEVIKNEYCGCFYCEKVYKSIEIKEWIDGGETACCPRCGIDSVLSSELPINGTLFLSKMCQLWFLD